jgi:hypothetical protein
MELIIKAVTFRRWLNERLRIPKRIEYNRISESVATTRYLSIVDVDRIIEQKIKVDVLCSIEFYKNKKIIKVYTNTDSRFLKPI